MGDSDNNSDGMFYARFDDGRMIPINESEFSCTINISEESAAHLWALIEGLEIVPRGEK